MKQTFDALDKYEDRKQKLGQDAAGMEDGMERDKY